MFIVLLTLTVASPFCFADFTDNFRWSVDASARLNNNIATDNTSQIYALGFDSHKVFTSANGDIGYAVGQLYFTQLSNQRPFPFMFDSADDSQFVVREAHLNYTAYSSWRPNIRIGHFTLPFGLEESIATNGRLLDYYHGMNLGTKLDWGIGVNKVLKHMEYNVSYTLGGKDDPKSVNGSHIISGRVGSLSHKDFIIGLSYLNGELDNIQRKRLAIDWQYYWTTWGLLGEFALGDNKNNRPTGNTTNDSEWQKEKYSLIEINKTSFNQQLKLYSQFIFIDKDNQKHTDRLVNIGLSYQLSQKFELSLSSRKQFNQPTSAKKQNLFRFQARYRY
jgi:hypothetical protein